jgi:hypothetical protein
MIDATPRSGNCMNNRLPGALPALLGSLVCLLLAACSASTEVSLTGNTPAQYSHVWITVSDVWFNSSSSAGPEDGGWRKFTLKTPSTLDLVALNAGSLGEITSGLRIEPGTYGQVRLIPVDWSTALTSSAQTAGAIYNSEADYVDSGGTTHQLPLELLSPATGIGIQTSLKVPVGSVSNALSGTGTTGSTNSATGSTTGVGIFGGTTDTTGTTGTTGTTTGTTNTPTPNSYATVVDGTSDLVPFSFAGNTPGILLSQHATAYDLSQAGAISGQLTLTNITTGSSGLPAIQVSAETLSADGSRHVVVSSTMVQADGSFMLYPLTTNSSINIPLTYDVVIHGPGIATIIIKSVQVPRQSSTTTPTPLTPATTSTSPTSSTMSSTTSSTAGTSTTATGTTSTTGSSTTVTPASIGTLTPRSATTYTATISTTAASPLPAGAVLAFYQTVARQGEVPYVIERSTIDPFNQVLFNPQQLVTGTIDSGTWSTNGGAITLVSAAPAEGAGNYDVAGTAPSYDDGAVNPQAPQVKAPASGTGPVAVVVSGLTLAAGAFPGSVSASVTAPPQVFEGGELLLSHDGTLVATASLASVLAQGSGTVTLTGVPAGTPSSLYYATVRLWNSAGVQNQSSPSAIDLRGGGSGAIELTIH